MAPMRLPPILAATLMLPVLPVHAGPMAPASRCASVGPSLAAGAPARAGFRRLDQLPPANEILTVMRIEGGCQKPVVVRYGIGGNPRLGTGAPEDGRSPPSGNR